MPSLLPPTPDGTATKPTKRLPRKPPRARPTDRPKSPSQPNTHESRATQIRVELSNSGQPRVLSPDFAKTEPAIADLLKALADHEAKTGTRLKPAAVRSAIVRLARSVPGRSDTNVLGRFYRKQVDAVVLADWLRGPDVLVSGKTQFSSYLNNKNNRYEEAIGEAHNLRDRYPLAAMGFAFVVRSNVFEGGAFDLLRDLLVRLRKPDGPFDATVLLVADWDDIPLKLNTVEDPANALALPRFFEDLLNAVMSYTPVDVHQGVRQQKLGEPRGGFPPSEDDLGDLD